MRLLFSILLFPLFTKAQTIRINGTGITVTINKPGAASNIVINPEVPQPPDPPDPLQRDLIYVAGQSNAGAYHHLVTDNSELVSRGFSGFKDSIFVFNSDHTFYNLNLPEVNTAVPYSTSPRDYWGMEQHTLHGWQAEYDKSVYLARRHGGGASITAFMAGGALRATWISYLTGAISDMVALGYHPRVTIIWIQGEEDSGTEAGYTAYEGRLRDLITEAKTLSTPYTTTLRWVNVKLMSSSYSGTGGQAINAAFDAVTDIANVYTYNPATVTDPWGGSHYTKEGLMQASAGLWAFVQAQGLFEN